MARTTTRGSVKRSAKAKRPTSSSATTEADREAAEAAKHAPVGFGSGDSLDRDRLQSGLDKIVKSEPDDREAAAQDALEDAREGDHTASTAGSLAPGHKIMRATTELRGGDDGLKVEELRQVYAGGDSDDQGSDAGQAVTGEPSTIVALDPVDDDDLASATPVSIPPKDGEGGESGSTTDVNAAAGIDRV